MVKIHNRAKSPPIKADSLNPKPFIRLNSFKISREIRLQKYPDPYLYVSASSTIVTVSMSDTYVLKNTFR